LGGRGEEEKARHPFRNSNPNRIKIKVTDLETNVTISYASIKEAAGAIGCDASSINHNLKSIRQKPYKGRYKFVIEKFSPPLSFIYPPPQPPRGLGGRGREARVPLFVHTTRRVVWKTWGLVPLPL
jgi:hypothetical protein